ncbi:hypothetical protein PoB_000803400, partial [Plakobranchus ocellatus]
EKKGEQGLKDEEEGLTQSRADRMSIDWIRQAQFRPQASQDSVWLKADLQACIVLFVVLCSVLKKCWFD